MLPSDERRLKVEEANERREWRERWLYPLIPEDTRPQPPDPTAAEIRRMERELIESIWESRKTRGDWSE
jgi:hypothetical protein